MDALETAGLIKKALHGVLKIHAFTKHEIILSWQLHEFDSYDGLPPFFWPIHNYRPIKGQLHKQILNHDSGCNPKESSDI